MPSWVALLRAVNLGNRNKVPMPELRRVFAAAGCEAVRTYIQSGNVVFEHEAPEAARLEEAVAAELGLKTAIVLREAKRMAALAAAHPFGDDTSKTVVAFLAAPPGRGAKRVLAELDIAPDRFELVGGDVVMHYPNGYGGARLTTAVLEKRLGVPATARNWRTVTRLAELSGPKR